MRQAKALYPTNTPGADFIKEFCERPDFQKAIEKLRQKWHVDVASEIHRLEIRKNSPTQEKLLRNKKFVAGLRALQKEFDLGEEWSSFIEEYVFVDLFAPRTSGIFVEKRTGNESDSVTGKPAYYLRIFPESTKDDISKAWGEINKFIGGTTSKSKRLKITKTRERDQLIYSLGRIGMCLEDIADHVEAVHGSKMNYLAIRTAEARHRKRMGIKETNKLGYRKTNKD